jgi:hypothetical protein
MDTVGDVIVHLNIERGLTQLIVATIQTFYVSVFLPGAGQFRKRSQRHFNVEPKPRSSSADLQTLERALPRRPMISKRLRRRPLHARYAR